MDGSRSPLVRICRWNTNQTAGFGSALTYTKRQVAQADWGITGDPDDDAEQASQPAMPELSEGAIYDCDDIHQLREWWKQYPHMQTAIRARVEALTALQQQAGRS